jgi:glycosyltransferase involved in cell wall biosynthesis
MDWFPNVEAVKFLVNEIWETVKLHAPEAQLYLAGRRMPGEINKFESESIHITGEVTDAQQFIQSKSVMAIPLLSGSGMRIKILEGMALGKAIVSTTIGAEGIDCTNEKDILLADSPAEFANQIVRCLQNPVLVSQLGQNARRLAEDEYDNTKIIFQLLEAYKKLR